MKINIVGGGPAGLYFAILMKARDPRHQITIYERNPAEVTWGWGVVFSSKTLDNLLSADSEVFASLNSQLTRWTDVVMLYQEREIRIHGNPFSAIARIDILKTLQERCRQLGVELHFGHAIDNVDALRDADLLIGADGINSAVREHYRDRFAPRIESGRNKFIWLGTPRLFDGLTLGFSTSDAGAFACHAYRFCDDTSTFIAECSEETWRRAGLDQATTEESIAYLEGVFAHDLRGHRLLSNNSSWIDFREVKNTNWHFDNVVLIGDALHTAHFSIGSGTKLAMEDSIVLADALTRSASISEALASFAVERQDAVDKLQRAAKTSQIWFEEMDSKMGPDPYLFSYDCMTRSGRVDLELLREQDADFVEAYEAALGRA